MAPNAGLPSSRRAGAKKRGSIRFVHDRANDIHIAYPNWLIETEEDCRAWFRQYETYFRRFGRKVDAIFVLDEFRIGPQIGTTWGNYRARMVREFTRHSVRVHIEARVSTFNATSAAIHGGGYEEARDLPTGVAMIREKRRADSPV
jgi:hypothetical protein